MAAYASYEDYLALYLLGREPVIPGPEFAYWERKAAYRLDAFTFGRLHDPEILAAYREPVALCACELAEYCFLTEDSIGKTSQSVTGYSVSYRTGGDVEIIRARLGNTGLLYSGV